MQIFSKIIISLTTVLVLSSCALMFNKKEVQVAINSTPPGADIFINGQNYGRTPTTIKIEPNNYTVVLNKPGYGSTQIELESWFTFRRQAGDHSRCIADILFFPIIPIHQFLSNKCYDFKKGEYEATIPYLGNTSPNSMMGVGQNPTAVINYHYGGNSNYNGYGGNPYNNNGYGGNPYQQY